MRRASYGGGRGAPRGNSSYSSRGSGFGNRSGGDNDSYRRGGHAGGGGNNFNNSLKNKQPGGALRKPKWENETLQPFQKNFYTPHPLVLNRYLLSSNYLILIYE